MSVFKKLVGFLFEEEEEIEEEGELETVSIHEHDDTYRSRPYDDEVMNAKHAPKAEQIRTESIRVKAQDNDALSQAALPKQETKFTNIELAKETKAPQQSKRGNERNQVRTSKRNEPMKTEFEFTPVISPIFGMDETTETKHTKAVNPNVPQVRATITAAPKKNPLGTVLSPMYGATELEEFEEEAKERLENNEPSTVTQIQSISEVLSYDDTSEEEDIVKVPLEELLSSEDLSEQSDDLLQFSLFGDDEVVSTEKTAASYTIKE